MTFRLTLAGLMVLFSLVGLGAGRNAIATRPGSSDRVEALQPTADERAIDRIGWASDIRSALRLARESGRPVFLFTMDGRFSIGRC